MCKLDIFGARVRIAATPAFAQRVVAFTQQTADDGPPTVLPLKQTAVASMLSVACSRVN